MFHHPCQCLLPLSALWVSKNILSVHVQFFFSFFKSLQFHLAVLRGLTLWTCLDMSLTLELPPSLFVTMGTRLERTQVTLCASNTQLIHRVSPSWEFHAAATSSQAPVLLFHDYKLVSAHCVRTYPRNRTHRTPPTFSSFTAGCFLVRGLALAPGSRLFKVEPCNY